MSKKLTKFVRVAVAGQTATDGRTIEPKWLTEMAANYNPATYTARVNVEHYRNASATGPFPVLGDVKALKVQNDDIEIAGKTEKRVALYAQIEGNETFQGYIAADQKKFSSIEVGDDFSGTGTAYLVGLAASDSPASLGTEAITFATRTDDAYAKQLKADLDARKQHPSNCFSSAYATKFEFEEAAAADEADGLFNKLVAKFAQAVTGPVVPPVTPPVAPAQPDQTTTFNTAFAAFAQEVGATVTAALAASDTATTTRFNTLQGEITALKGQLEDAPSRTYTGRKPAPGGDGRVRADC